MANNDVGDIDDPRCRANMVKRISRRECRNNCKYWGYLKKGKSKRGCQLGY